MAILIDLSQFVIASALELHNGKERIPLTVDIIRHVTLNSLRMYRLKHHAKFGELIICRDHRSWRYDAFPLYKAARKIARDEEQADNSIPWDIIFEANNTIGEELTEFFPYRVLHVRGAEADDCIAVMARESARRGEQTLILSSDRDFLQLHAYPGVSQFSPAKKRDVVCSKTPQEELKEKIIRGDKGDGIPNIRSADDCIVMGVRQKSITEKFLKEHMEKEPEEYAPEIQRNFARNRMLIDLIDCIPKEVDAAILVAYDQAPTPPRSGLLNFFMQKRLRNLMDKIQDF